MLRKKRSADSINLRLSHLNKNDRLNSKPYNNNGNSSYASRSMEVLNGLIHMLKEERRKRTSYATRRRTHITAALVEVAKKFYCLSFYVQNYVTFRSFSQQ